MTTLPKRPRFGCFGNGRRSASGRRRFALAVAALAALGSAQHLWAYPLGDATFGVDGEVLTTIGGRVTCADVVLQPDGKLLVVGSSEPEYPSDSVQDMVLIRYEADGSLDATFGAGGIVTTDLDGADEFPRSLALQHDGKILVGVALTPPLDERSGALVRYLSDGQLDPDFGLGGIVRRDEIEPGRVLPQVDGTIVLARCTFPECDLVGLLEDGSPDVSFGSGGTLHQTFGVGGASPHPDAWGPGLLPDGRIVVAESFDPNAEQCPGGGDSCSDGSIDLRVRRYAANGSLDQTFGNTGVAHASYELGDGLTDLLIQPDGKIVVALRLFYRAEGSGLGLGRFYPDGVKDATFEGHLTGLDGASESAATAVVVQPDGKLVVAGQLETSSVPLVVSLVLRRFEASVCGNGTLETSEECDDGNRSTDDGCSDICKREPDALRCYRGHAAGGTSLPTQEVALQSAFADRQGRVMKSSAFCNPVSHDGRGIDDPTSHLACYPFTPTTSPPRTVRIHDRFGDHELRLKGRADVCVPSTEDGVPLAQPRDNFTCYLARTRVGTARFVPQSASLADELGTTEGEVMGPAAFCVATRVDASRFVNPSQRFACYRFVNRRTGAPRHGVQLSNRFGDQAMSVHINASTLCVPATFAP